MKTFVALCVIIIGAIVCCTSSAIDGGADRQGRADPIIAGQRNQVCTGRNADVGTCQSRSSCRRSNGTSSGMCGIGSGVCCTHKLSENEATNLKRVIMSRPADNSMLDFNYRFTAVNERVCQIRLDFRVLDLAQPVITSSSNGSAGSTSECSAEYVIVAGMKLCGMSKNQHVYLPLDNKKNTLATLQIHLTSSTTPANWNILATQLECGPGTGVRLARSVNEQGRAEDGEVEVESIRTRSTIIKDAPFVAPPGCLQYYPNSTGTVSTFNFDSTDETMRQYLPNLNYAICFNRFNNEKMNINFESFRMSDRGQNSTSTNSTSEAAAASKASADDPMVPGQMDEMSPTAQSNSTATANSTVDTVDSLCAWMGVQPSPVILQDYLMIPQAIYRQSPNTLATYFCGSVLDKVNVTNYNEMGPFVMRFFSDNFIDTTLDAEKGFRFTYRLVV